MNRLTLVTDLTPTTESAFNPEAARRHCFRLLREVTGQLGWRYRAYIPAVILLSTVFLLPPRFLQFFTESIQSISEISAERFLFLLLAFGAAVAICTWLAVFLSGILREWLRLKVSIGLRRDTLKSLHQTRIDALDTAHRGDWMTRVTSDLRNVEGFLADSLPEQIQSLTMVLGAAALFFASSGWIALIPLAAALLLAWLNVAVQKKMAPTLGQVRELEGEVFQTMIENFEGLRTIRSFGGEHVIFQRFNARLAELFQAGMRIIRTMAGLMGLNEFAGQIVITIVLTVAALSLKSDSLTPADVLVYPFFINLFLNHTKSLVAAAYDWNRFFIEGGRLATVLYEENDRVQDPEKLFGDFFSADDCRKLAVSGLTVGYGDSEPVLRNRNFSLMAGELVALMGPSGCGKSTFLETFAGLRPAHEGSFLLENNAGEIGPFSQAPPFVSAFVEQRPFLFIGSVRENLTLGLDPNSIDDDRIQSALTEVGLSELVADRGGLDAILTDRGQNLSEGQRYRLSLCRGLLSARPFLLLDEPFAALDAESIACVTRALQTERDQGRGILLVTHQFPPELKADRIEKLTA